MTAFTINHYQTLEVAETASQGEIKQAYRRLAKELHPDSQSTRASHEQITQLNAAYEILGDRQRRAHYDRQRQRAGVVSEETLRDRAERAAHSQAHYRQRRQAAQAADDAVALWLKQVYTPVDRYIGKIMSPLKAEIRALSGDPFDDELMAAFQAYLESCQELLEKAQARFQTMPNPANAAAVAANLYHCLSQLEDGVEEMERYTYCYEESYLHTGKELFRIAAQLRREAKARLKTLQ
jgi:molecular chaperone DnaJ